MVIWITGLSGAGKSTLCRTVRTLLQDRQHAIVVLDGDAVRAAFDNDLGYREKDRVVQIQRMQRLARLLSDQGLVVVVAALYSHPDLLKWNRANLRGYFEVYMKASLSTLAARDPKGLYREASAGLRQNIVGIDIPWHAPVEADLILDADCASEPEEWARLLISSLTDRSSTLPCPVKCS